MLQEAKIPVISNQQCRKLNTNSTHVEVTEHMLCAGYGSKSRISGCHGDSGGKQSNFFLLAHLHAFFI